jgi:hypothetical protein
MKKIFLALLFLSNFAWANSNYLTLYFIKSPTDLNWNTPQTLAATSLVNQITPTRTDRKFSIGHVFVEYSCPRLSRYNLTAMTTTGSTQERDMVLKKHYGLGAMLAEFDGMLEPQSDVLQALPQLYATGRTSFLKILINEDACERIVRYMDEYNELGLDKIYAGLHAYPLRKEGSGCSAFGASFLDVTGLLRPEFKKFWTRQFGVPKKYVGGPRTGRQVRIEDLLTRFGSQWTHVNDPSGIPIHFYDPNLMYAWVNQESTKIRNQQSTLPFPKESLLRGLSKGILLDMTKVEAPTGPIFND